jgi:hypothetical protein
MRDEGIPGQGFQKNPKSRGGEIHRLPSAQGERDGVREGFPAGARPLIGPARTASPPGRRGRCVPQPSQQAGTVMSRGERVGGERGVAQERFGFDEARTPDGVSAWGPPGETALPAGSGWGRPHEHAKESRVWRRDGCSRGSSPGHHPGRGARRPPAGAVRQALTSFGPGLPGVISPRSSTRRSIHSNRESGPIS